MDRWIVGSIVMGVASFLVILWAVPQPEIIVGAAVAIPSFILNVVQYRHGRRPAPPPPPPAAPDLVVEYRNVRMDDKPIVWHPQVAANTSRYVGCDLHVYLINKGEGPAEAVEVRFDSLGASDIWNESGGYAHDVNTQVHPPRFEGGTRILYPHREWGIARLVWHTKVPRAVAMWQAFARNMEPKEGVIRITVLDEPPPELRNG